MVSNPCLSRLCDIGYWRGFEDLLKEAVVLYTVLTTSSVLVLYHILGNDHQRANVRRQLAHHNYPSIFQLQFFHERLHVGFLQEDLTRHYCNQWRVSLVLLPCRLH